MMTFRCTVRVDPTDRALFVAFTDVDGATINAWGMTKEGAKEALEEAVVARIDSEAAEQYDLVL